MISKEDLINKYLLYREKQKKLHDFLMKQVVKKAYFTAASELGIKNDNNLSFNSECEMYVLFDYIIYDYRFEGKNAIDRYINRYPMKNTSEDKALIEAMKNARYSIFRIDGLDENVGINLTDILRMESVTIIDLSFREAIEMEKVPIGTFIAGRIISPENLFWMTTGAALPGNPFFLDKIADYLKENFSGHIFKRDSVSLKNMSGFSTFSIQTLLKSGISETIQYEN